MTKLTVTHEYVGNGDYWSGNGRRWDDDAGCLFAFYGAGTTLKDCVEEWVNDFNAGGDCDSLPDDITSDDVHAAILESLTEEGRADYESDAIANCAVDLAESMGINCCAECCECIGDRHAGDCGKRDVEAEYVIDEDCPDEEDFEGYSDSPMWVILVECEN